MTQNRLPPGWDTDRVQRVLDHYEQQTDLDAVAEAATLAEDSIQTVMKVPRKLVPTIRELIAKHSA